MAYTESQQGVAKIYGMMAQTGSSATMVTLTGAATVTHESADIEESSTVAEVRGQNGDTEALISSNRVRTCTIQFTPNGANRTAAIASFLNAQPAKISKVVLSKFMTDLDTSLYNGSWNSMGYSIKMSRDGVATMTIKLKAYMANRAALTNGVVA